MIAAPALGAASAISTTSWSPGSSPAQQRIGEDLLEACQRTAGLALQFLDINLVDRGQLENELHGERALVALDQVEIGGRDAQRLGHGRLGQALGVADAADARTGEDLLFSHCNYLYRFLQTLVAVRGGFAFTIVTNLHAGFVKRKTA
jgi:hypothetical protein